MSKAADRNIYTWNISLYYEGCFASGHSKCKTAQIVCSKKPFYTVPVRTDGRLQAKTETIKNYFRYLK